jgi:hypothetical protein
MKTLILDASGHIWFSWKSEHAISHFLQPLHLESSLAIQIGSFFFFGNRRPLKNLIFHKVCFNLNLMFILQLKSQSCVVFKSIRKSCFSGGKLESDS